MQDLPLPDRLRYYQDEPSLAQSFFYPYTFCRVQYKSDQRNNHRHDTFQADCQGNCMTRRSPPPFLSAIYNMTHHLKWLPIEPFLHKELHLSNRQQDESRGVFICQSATALSTFLISFLLRLSRKAAVIYPEVAGKQPIIKIAVIMIFCNFHRIPFIDIFNDFRILIKC